MAMSSFLSSIETSAGWGAGKLNLQTGMVQYADISEQLIYIRHTSYKLLTDNGAD